MVDLGSFFLVIAFLLSSYGAIAGIIGARKQHAALTRSAANSVLLCAIFSVLSLGALAVAFLTHDYRYVYVWQTSNNAMPPQYLVSAIWGGMDGSMLLWASIMTIFAGLVVRKSKEIPRKLFVWLVPVLSSSVWFFLLVVTFLTNPFRLVPGDKVLADGNGLNPLLQNPSMMIHPPMLYLGFTGFVVPFAFCLAALCSGELSDSWIRLTRRWTLVAWGFLSTGIILGGHWAYIELGWGGFWAWDPVENASFLPWLTGTAYLHSVMVQERKGMLKVWNVCLAITTYGLTVFGTFLTRSGVVQSVHAFAETDVGWVFLAYLGVIVVLTTVLLARRWSELKPERQLESYFSREAAFLFNNLALLAICFTTFWGVVFPIVSEAVAGEKSTVGPPFFNQVNTPLFLVLLFLMGVGPLIAWKRSSLSMIARVFIKPFIAGSLLTALFIYLDSSRIATAVCFGLCLFVLLTIESELRRAVKVRKQLSGGSVTQGLAAVVRRSPRRYGGMLVHVGVAIMAVSIAASMSYKIERDIALKKGESAEVGPYRLELAGVDQRKGSNYSALVANVNVYDLKSGEFLKAMDPERRAYTGSQEVTTEVDLRVTPRDDLYLALAGLETAPGEKAHDHSIETLPVLLKVFVNPLQVWLWFGGVVMLFGTCIIMFQQVLEPKTVREAVEVQTATGRV